MAASCRRHPDRPPTHPGEILKEDVIPALGKSKAEIARLLGLSRQALYDILNERQAVTPAVAVRLGKLLGSGPELWLRLQQAHDIWYANRDLKDELAAIPTLKVA